MGTVTSTKLSVLVNGEAVGFFGMERGLKQGDPLSPFLFNIVIDLLSHILLKMSEAGMISGFCMDESSRSGEMTHLLYADDAIIFCDASEEEILNVTAALVCFQSITGLRINLEKSRVFPVGEVDDIERYVEIVGCDWGFLPTLYLGMPLVVSPTTKSIWDPVISRMQRKLDGWKGRFLSTGGRIILSNACLAS
ncbi:unnamed protein product [Linum trigynum]|uniref:Reverse transcriptase domain-containing protein n=1 Tax=Linum trigynum TaxID=586398 RepID=A0AAV2CGP1_9ROSI